jgi:signal transduction histidine kinase
MTLRISTPIDNDPACQVCHGEVNHLGMLLIDVSLVDTRRQLISDLTADLTISVGFTLLITMVVYFLMQRLIVNRVEQLKNPLAALASGDFTVRLPEPRIKRDELDALTHNVNRMADDLERYIDEREQLHTSRYQAMLEERERIAREMHDGVAQLMSYVHTKAGAIRLLLKEDEKEIALKQIEQLSSVSQEGALDIRASILGLRARDLSDEGIHAILKVFLQKFQELTGVEIESDLPQVVDEIVLPPESELHVLRITQEALTNIHKHSGSTQAYVALRRTNGQIELRIRDEGDGFNQEERGWKGEFSFGLKNMRERARAMGATLEILTLPQRGTEIVLRIPQEQE